eukprot:CAMPEP_0180503094 /NCGR_PEP_ID=MMETSP1036_2-20121128/45832_1 /TAXON_ID=632150 /ORGANISM="Azadinium spinosum, Strain 3D9" /LENGTH=66 /DNA_ID=CAMNT_0022512065 /DNA_START=463 /DNA_END=663 /DNA_ORIENTATION=-
MACVTLMHVGNGIHELPHEDCSFHLGAMPRDLEMVQERPAAAELHDQMHIPAVFEGIIKLDDVRVI